MSTGVFPPGTARYGPPTNKRLAAYRARLRADRSPRLEFFSLAVLRVRKLRWRHGGWRWLLVPSAWGDRAGRRSRALAGLAAQVAAAGA